MENTPFTLILDDETSGLGEIALRLLRLGVDVFYANDADEALLFCAQAEAQMIRAVMFPEELAMDALAKVVPRLPATGEGCGPSLVAVGELADDERIAELRKFGVDRALRPPFDDSTLRWISNAARFENDHHPKRMHERAPTNLLARASWGLKRKDLVCSTLSSGGAFLETPSPIAIGARVKLRIPLSEGNLTVKAVVANHAEGVPDLRGEGMGVTFVNPGEKELLALSSFVQQRTADFIL